MTDELCSAVERTEEEKRGRRKGEKKKEKTEKETNLSPRATWASVRIRIIRTRADADAHGNIPGKQLDAVTPFVLKTFTVVLVVAALKLAASRGNFWSWAARSARSDWSCDEFGRTNGWMDVRHTLERNVLTQLKRADKYEREERRWDGMGHALSREGGTR